MHHPLKQGLRRSQELPSNYNYGVRVHHPLKQGLRPKIKATQAKEITVRVHHPLKQGLRPSLALKANAFQIEYECIIH